jgi:hypothetical protein
MDLKEINWKYYDMTPKRRRSAISEAPQKTSNARQQLTRWISGAMDTFIETKAFYEINTRFHSNGYVIHSYRPNQYRTRFCVNKHSKIFLRGYR